MGPPEKPGMALLAATPVLPAPPPAPPAAAAAAAAEGSATAGPSEQNINNNSANNSTNNRNLSKKDIEDLENKRDAFVTSMRTLSLAAESAARSGYDYFNALVGHSGFPEPETGSAGALQLDPLSYNAHVLARARSVAPELLTGAGGKKGQHNGDDDGKKRRRKRAEKDPDAPKKPLTPYFQFFQEARPAIVQELGGKATLQQLNDICGRTWRELPTEEQKVWQLKYQSEMLTYQANMNAYRAERGLPPLKETKAQKRNLAAFLEENVDVEVHEAEEAEDVDAEDHNEHRSLLEDVEQEEEEEEPPAPTPPPPSKKTKTTASQRPNGATRPTLPSASKSQSATANFTPVSVPEAEETATESPLPAKRNRKNSKKKEEADAASAEVAKSKGKNRASTAHEYGEEHSVSEAGPQMETPKSKDRRDKKSRKRRLDIPSDE